MTAPATPGGKRRVPTTVILLAVLVAAVLIGVAMFLYLESQTKETPAPAAPGASLNAEDEVSAEDVDETVNEVDETINGIDDSDAFNEDDLSDDTLSL